MSVLAFTAPRPLESVSDSNLNTPSRGQSSPLLSQQSTLCNGQTKSHFLDQRDADRSHLSTSIGKTTGMAHIEQQDIEMQTPSVSPLKRKADDRQVVDLTTASPLTPHRQNAGEKRIALAETENTSNSSPIKPSDPAEVTAAKEQKRAEREARKAEKAQKDAERQAKLDKANKIQKRSANFMSNFIVQRRASPSTTSPTKDRTAEAQVSDYERIFPPCTFKDLAPVNRFRRTPSEGFEQKIGSCSTGVSSIERQDLLQEIVKPRTKKAKSVQRRSRRGVHAPVSVREAMRLVTEAGVMGDDRLLEENGKRGLANLTDRKRVPIKLLAFATDRRPPWFGTWTRSSNFVSARRPFGQDPVALDYTYDSDMEWEDVDPLEGDDLNDNDDKDDEDKSCRSDSDSEMDDWLVDDLEEEDEEMGEGAPAAGLPSMEDPFKLAGGHSLAAVASKPVPTELGIKRKKKFKPIGRRFETKLIAFQTGPHWETELGTPSYDGFQAYQMEMINDAVVGLNPFTFTSADPVRVVAEGADVSATKLVDPLYATAFTVPAQLSASADETSSAIVQTDAACANLARAKMFPASRLGDLLRVIEGKTCIKPVLVEELKGHFESLGKQSTKTILEACLNVYAEKRKKADGGQWAIKPAFRDSYGI